MKAVVSSAGTAAVIDSARPTPILRDDCILVRTVAVALNPTDWKHLLRGWVPDGCILGCDFAGTVEAVGRGVRKAWRQGERVAGVVHGGNPANADDGAFAEIVVAKGDLCLRIPDGMDLEEAATLALGVGTVGQGLYQKGLLLCQKRDPGEGERFVLIYGGSTATGALGVQFAKLSGYTVLATASGKNLDYVRSLGADEVFDYTQPNVGVKMRDYTSNNLTLVWDVISTAVSAKICAEALSSNGHGCRYASFLSNKSPREDVVSVGTMLYTIWGESFTSGGVEWPESREDYESGVKFMLFADTLLAAGKLRPCRFVIGERGLDGAIEGLKEGDKVAHNRGKLVYRIADTS